MNQSHERSAGSRQNSAPDVIAHPATPARYHVLRRAPQLTGDPEHAVCRGEQRGEVVALFFSVEAAAEYCGWKNGVA